MNYALYIYATVSVATQFCLEHVRGPSFMYLWLSKDMVSYHVQM